jgi:hypothetical protein
VSGTRRKRLMARGAKADSLDVRVGGKADVHRIPLELLHDTPNAGRSHMRTALSRFRFAALSSAFLAAALVAGCERTWHLEIVSQDASGPTFCFSNGGHCHGGGVQFSLMAVDLVDASGARIKPVWQVQCMDGQADQCMLQRLHYGARPKGWLEGKSAEPIQTGKYYGVNGTFYFMRRSDGRYEVWSREQFLQRARG